MKQRILMVLFSVGLTVVFIAPLSFIYLITRDMVTRNEQAFVKKSVLSAAGIAPTAAAEDVISVFSARVEEISGGGSPTYRVKDETGNTAGYVLTRTGPGLWGEITAVVGFEADGKTLAGLDFLKQSETPGLGARVAEAWFKEQFRGKSGPFTTVPEGESDGVSQFDAITGATITSNAVKNIVNAAVEAAGELAQ